MFAVVTPLTANVVSHAPAEGVVAVSPIARETSVGCVLIARPEASTFSS